MEQPYIFVPEAALTQIKTGLAGPSKVRFPPLADATMRLTWKLYDAEQTLASQTPEIH